VLRGRTSAANQSVSFLYRSKHCRKHASWPSVPLPSVVLCSITTPPMPRCAYSSLTHSDLACARGTRAEGPGMLGIQWQRWVGTICRGSKRGVTESIHHQQDCGSLQQTQARDCAAGPKNTICQLDAPNGFIPCTCVSQVYSRSKGRPVGAHEVADGDALGALDLPICDPLDEVWELRMRGWTCSASVYTVTGTRRGLCSDSALSLALQARIWDCKRADLQQFSRVFGVCMLQRHDGSSLYKPSELPWRATPGGRQRPA